MWLSVARRFCCNSRSASSSHCSSLCGVCFTPVRWTPERDWEIHSCSYSQMDWFMNSLLEYDLKSNGKKWVDIHQNDEHTPPFQSFVLLQMNHVNTVQSLNRGDNGDNSAASNLQPLWSPQTHMCVHHLKSVFISPACVNVPVLGVFWECFRSVLRVFWECFGSVLGVFSTG